MELLLIIILLNVVAAAITLVTAYNGIFSKADEVKPRIIFRKNVRRRLTKKGAVLFGCLGISIVLAIAQYFISNREEQKQLLARKIDQDKRDSIAELKSNNRNNLTIKSFTEALAKYGLKYDTAQQAIKKLLQDSAKRTTIISAEQPVIKLFNRAPLTYEGYSNGQYRFKVRVSTYEAAARNVYLTLNIYAASQNYETIVPVIKSFTFTYANVLAKEEVRINEFNLWTDINKPNFIFYLRGSYYNSLGSNKYQVDELYGYELSKSDSGYFNEPLRKEILSKLK